jgi:hypothetical protein
MPNSEGAIYTLPRLWRKNKVVHNHLYVVQSRLYVVQSHLYTVFYHQSGAVVVRLSSPNYLAKDCKKSRMSLNLTGQTTLSNRMK